MNELAEGAAAPDFDLETPEGRVRLADFVGKTVVLYFYPKDDTTGCTKEAQEFTALAGEFAKAGVTVIGGSKDTLAAQGAEAAPGTPEQFGSHVKSELAKWAQVVKTAGIRAD